jgi:NAD(P)H dehydrogenase (quinone)
VRHALNGSLQRVEAQGAVRDPRVEAVAISRTPGSVTGSVERRPGDYDQAETLASAYVGLDRLVIIPSADMRREIRSKQFIAAIDAALTAGVKHIVLVSAIGTRKQEEPHIIAPYWVGEQHLMKTAPAWTIVRMNYYAESFADDARMSADAGKLTGLADNQVAYVSRDDLAAAVAGVLVVRGMKARSIRRPAREALPARNERQ